MGSKPKSTSSSASGSAQAWAQPYARQAAQDVLATQAANQGNLDALVAGSNAQLGNLQGQGGQIGQQLGQFGQTAGKANNFTGQVIGGQFMEGNPYIRNIMGQMGEQILGDVGSAFSSAGRYGSGAYTGVLSDKLGDAYAQLLYGNYDDEMNRRMQASQMAYGALGQQQDAQAANNQQILAQQALSAEMPYIGSNNTAQSLGALFSGGTQTATQTGASPFWGALGAGLGAAGSIFAGKSDRRAKTKITLLGREDDGLGWYEFAYNETPDTMQIGVMADEVKELRPWAYIPNFEGDYAGVDYGRLAA